MMKETLLKLSPSTIQYLPGLECEEDTLKILVTSHAGTRQVLQVRIASQSYVGGKWKLNHKIKGVSI